MNPLSVEMEVVRDRLDVAVGAGNASDNLTRDVLIC
jgi:hypothetical protein